MKTYPLDFPLSDGYIDHWLVTTLTGKDLNDRNAAGENVDAFRQQVLAEVSSDVLPYQTPPYELLNTGTAYWLVQHCKADHLVEMTTRLQTWRQVERWGYLQITQSAATTARAELDVSCAAAVWCNGDLVFRSADLQPLDHQGHAHHSFDLPLKRGKNHLYLQLVDVGLGEMLLSAALRLNGPKLQKTTVILPIQYQDPEQRKKVDNDYQIACLTQSVYSGEQRIAIHALEETEDYQRVVVRMQDTQGGIRAETYGNLEPGTTIYSLVSFQFPVGQMLACVMPEPELFYNHKFHPQRDLPFINAPVTYYHMPETSYEDRLVLLSRETAHSGGIFGEIAKMYLGWWENVSVADIRKVLARIGQLGDGCLVDLIGVIGMASRLAQSSNFPAELLPEIKSAIIAFPYQPEEAVRPLLSGETEQLLLATCQALAGQLYPRVRFSASGLTGAKERKQGENTLVEMLRQGGRMGWVDGYARLEERVIALSHLADLAENETILELAAILLDQTAFALAQYSFHGLFATPLLDTRRAYLKTNRLDAATSINLLLFGIGCYNKRLAGAFSLGIARNYELPALIRDIALDHPEGAWTVERSARPEQEWEANQAVYEMPEYMLASLQDYRPGEWGGRVHAWQATLGPEAVVFTSHPTTFNQLIERQAGAWNGNGSLPRIAQWKDSLICLYQLPENDRMSFTHAYFPTFAFSEYRLEQDWAFARVGDAYLAIYASSGLELVERSEDSKSELRSPGPQTAWLVQMGRKADDGSFEDFQAKLLSNAPIIENLSVDWLPPRGVRLQFNWTGPIKRNGVEWPLTGGKRFEGPFVDGVFPSNTMDIGHGELLMRLDLS